MIDLVDFPFDLKEIEIDWVVKNLETSRTDKVGQNTVSDSSTTHLYNSVIFLKKPETVQTVSTVSYKCVNLCPKFSCFAAVGLRSTDLYVVGYIA